MTTSLPDRIYLMGFMGSGKTTLGKKMAAALGYQFVDTDQMIEQKLGMKISGVFQLLGEEKFREEERDVLLTTLKMEHTIIATGGGLPCFNNLMQVILENGFSIYLKGSPEFILSRIRSGIGTRPLLAGKTEEELLVYITGLLSQREPIYDLANAKLDLPLKSVETLLKSMGFVK